MGVPCKRTGCVKTKAGNPPILYIFISGVTFEGKQHILKQRVQKEEPYEAFGSVLKRIQHAVIQMPELEEEMEIRGITCNSQKGRRRQSVCLHSGKPGRWT